MIEAAHKTAMEKKNTGIFEGHACLCKANHDKRTFLMGTPFRSYHHFSEQRKCVAVRRKSRSCTSTHPSEQRRCSSAHSPGLLSDWLCPLSKGHKVHKSLVDTRRTHAAVEAAKVEPHGWQAAKLRSVSGALGSQCVILLMVFDAIFSKGMWHNGSRQPLQ